MLRTVDKSAEHVNASLLLMFLDVYNTRCATTKPHEARPTKESAPKGIAQ
jgi:hypothetical protein